MSLLLMLLFSLSGAVIGSAKMAGLLQPDGGVRGSTAVYMPPGVGPWHGTARGPAAWAQC